MSDDLAQQPRFTRGEYWLLEAVVWNGLLIEFLDSDQLAGHVNKQAHGMPRELLEETLLGLFTAGLINAETAEAEHLSLNVAQIRAALDVTSPESRANDGLTAKGGAQWEAFAAPNWERYVKTARDYPDDGDSELERQEVICQDRKTTSRFMESICEYDLTVVEGSVQWDLLEPWQATYWKVLPHGHRVRFDGTRKPGNDEEWPPRRMQLRSWYDRLWYGWR